MDNPTISRRNFLKSSAILGGGLLISFNIPQSGRLAGFMPSTAGDLFIPNAFLKIAADNSITVILAHSEMGQGIWTTLPMLIAEELDADWKDIKVEHCPVDSAYNHTVFGIQITGGSSTTWSEFDRYRMAGATARVLLVRAAAKYFSVAENQCKSENGFVIAGTNKISYGELVNEASSIPIPQNIVLRPPSQWKFIGKGVKRLDSFAKSSGQAKFGMDIQFPGLLTALVAHPPEFGGKVKSFDAAKSLAIPGVRQVIEIPTGVAVIADNFWAAREGRKSLHIEWVKSANPTLDTPLQVENYKRLLQNDGLVAAQKGNVKTAKAEKIINAEYIFPYLAHAPMEPLNCTVRISENSCEIWTGTQLPGFDQVAAARILGLKPGQVTVNTMFLGGGFGRRATPDSDFVSEGVEIAKASGKFIKMVWTREDDIKGGYYRPAFVHKLTVGLDQNGMPALWQHNIAGQSIMANTPFASMAVKDGIDSTSVEGIADSPYLSQVANHFIGLHTVSAPVPVLWFRSVGNTHTAFVMETMIDEIAFAAGKDPVSYRRRLLKDHPRHLAALNLAVEKSGWDKPLNAGHFRGIAVHESFGSCVSQVVELSLNKGQLKVHKVTCAIDCGVAVNPDGVRAQMESGIIFGLTMALYGEVTIENGMVKQSNFYDYRITRMNEAPVIEVFIVDSAEKMGGAGECAVPPLGPALANALFAASGKRVYELPVKNNYLKMI
jgi:isoquinoline 1-oxidoreductase subunit beta